MIEVPLARSSQVAELWKVAFPKGPEIPRDVSRIADKGAGVSPALTTEVLFRVRGDGPDVSAAALVAAWSEAIASTASAVGKKKKIV